QRVGSQGAHFGEELNRTWFLALGPLQSGVGILDQRFGVGAVAWVDRDADAGPSMMVSILSVMAGSGDRPDRRIGKRFPPARARTSAAARR
ncbi:MAG: hypothetical protein FD153_1301, partial [Rhodospirillaceae bacterium]